MTEKNSLAWMSLPTVKTIDVSNMSLDQLIDMLDGMAAPETAKAFGEIKGLYAAYKLAPSNVLLEAIIAKCLILIFNMKADAYNVVAQTPVKSSRTHPSSMDWEWVQAFEHFLLLIGISENSRLVYIRALKRVMKKHGIESAETLKQEIGRLIDEYDGCDQTSHNVHIAVLRQFKSFMDDECGYFVSVEMNGEEEIVSRIYCTLALAKKEFDDVVAEYGNTADVIKLYDKFANLIKEHKMK